MSFYYFIDYYFIIKLTKNREFYVIVDIIKLEDLTLDEITSRIKSLDPAFTENKLFFTHADTSTTRF